MTRGIADPGSYYYRRVYTDAVRAVEAARSHPEIDPAHVAVTGVSQGGGIAIAVAGLMADLKASLPDVPSLCHFRRGTEITDAAPYAEVVGFLRVHRDKVDRGFSTPSYFDGMQFAARAQCRALFSAALIDEVCPPSTVFAAFNHWAGPNKTSASGHSTSTTVARCSRWARRSAFENPPVVAPAGCAGLHLKRIAELPAV